MIKAVSSISNVGLKSINDGEQVPVDPVRRVHTALFTPIRERRVVTGARVTKCW